MKGLKERVLFHTHIQRGISRKTCICSRPAYFLAELKARLHGRAGNRRFPTSQHIPPKGVQLIRRYGLYSSRTKRPGVHAHWDRSMLRYDVAERAPAGWKIQHESQTGTSDPGDFETFEDTDFSDDSPDTHAYKKAWARLLSKVYEIDPMVCPKCGSK